MDLKNSIESIELYSLGNFSSMLTKKYKFISSSDIINIWNLTFNNKTGDTDSIPQKKSTVRQPKKSKEELSSQRSELRLLNKRNKQDAYNILKQKTKIQDSDCFLKQRTSPQSINTKEKFIPGKIKEEIPVYISIKPIEIEEKDENKGVEEEGESEIVDNIIKKLLFSEDVVSIPTYVTNYLNSSKIAMNIEKIIEYDDIEEILQDINF